MGSDFYKTLKKMETSATTVKTTTMEQRRVPKSGVAVGKNAGFKVTPMPVKRLKIQDKKKAFQRAIVREVLGFKPYEIKVVEHLKSNHANVEKRAKKYAKKRLGNYRRAKKKVAQLQKMVRENRL